MKLTKKVINAKLAPPLSKGKRGAACKVGLWRIVRAILKRLKRAVDGANYQSESYLVGV